MSFFPRAGLAAQRPCFSTLVRLQIPRRRRSSETDYGASSLNQVTRQLPSVWHAQLSSEWPRRRPPTFFSCLCACRRGNGSPPSAQGRSKTIYAHLPRLRSSADGGLGRHGDQCGRDDAFFEREASQKQTSTRQHTTTDAHPLAVAFGIIIASAGAVAFEADEFGLSDLRAPS